MRLALERFASLKLSDSEWEERDRQVEEARAFERQRQKHRALEKCGIGERYFTERLNTYKRTRESELVYQTVCDYLERVQCGEFRTLVLCGNHGTGKTHLASGLLFELGGLYCLSDKIRIEYESAKNFKAPAMQEEVIQKYGTVNFLVIDDIGWNGGTETEKHCLYRIINERYNNRLPTVLICNMSQGEFSAYVGSAVFDRLSESATFCDCLWESYRLHKRSYT